MLADVAGLGAADIALLEIVEGKLDFELVEKPGEEGVLNEPKKRKRG